MKILLLSEGAAKIPPLFPCIAQLFAANLLNYASPDLTLPSGTGLIIVDLDTNDGASIVQLRSFLEKHPAIPQIGLADIKQRQKLTQAKALGIKEIWPSDIDVREALSLLKNRVGDYSKPDLPADTPADTKQSIEQLCSALDEISLSVITGAALPVSKCLNAINQTIKAIQSNGISEWISVVQGHHSHTFCHSLMVTGYACAFSNLLGTTAEERAALGLGALIHDIGKVRIPLSILDKPGKLSKNEFALIKKHPVYSRQILSGRTEIPGEIIDLAVRHHEYLDGSGYPDALSGDQISRSVRMLTICDIYSALTEKRAYKDSFPPRQAYMTLAEMKGKIDQDLLQRFRPLAIQSDFGMVKRNDTAAARTFEASA
jgi:HD-GYP domain-containing protein (c-di-GMP phosphodiesterase class II)